MEHIPPSKAQGLNPLSACPIKGRVNAEGIEGDGQEGPHKCKHTDEPGGDSIIHGRSTPPYFLARTSIYIEQLC